MISLSIYNDNIQSNIANLSGIVSSSSNMSPMLFSNNAIDSTSLMLVLLIILNQIITITMAVLMIM